MSRHLMAKMRKPRTAWFKTAEPTKFNYILDPHQPHDWQEHRLWEDDEINSEVNRQQNIIPRKQHKLLTYDWHPLVGETHARYSVDPDFAGSTDGGHTGWRASHKGLYQGHRQVQFEDDEEPQMWPRYHRSDPEDYEIKSPDGSTVFPTAEAAIAAAQEHFARTYGGGQHRPTADYYDDIMNNLPDIDEDYGDIFGGGS